MRTRKLYENSYRVFIGLFLSVAFLSCEKVIDINLNKANPKYVIEGNMSDIAGDCKIIITKTINFSDPSIFPGVENAFVSIQEDSKEPIKLIQTSPGIYESDQVMTRPSHTYTLQVNVEGQEFISRIKAPAEVSFDSLFIADFSGFGSTRKFANVIFRDAAGLDNSYRFIQYKNYLPNSNIFVLNDEYSDGRIINTFLAFFDNSDNQRLDTGDTVMVEMQGIDRSVYKFFQSLSQSSTGGNESVAPGNPVTNISGGAIGYFNAYLKQRKTIIVP